MANLFGFDFSGILSSIRTFVGPIGQLFDKIKEGASHVANLRISIDKLRQSILDEIAGWKSFKQDIRVKQRVVNLETAFTKTKDLIEGIPASWNAIKDIFAQIREKFSETTGTSDAAAEATAAAEDIEQGGVKTLLTKFPKLAKALERIVIVVGLIADALKFVSDIVDDVQTIVDEIKRLRLEVEKLDTIFLPQSNKRKTLKLADGSTIRIRTGKLHESLRS